MQIVVESMRGRVTPTGDAERYGGTTTIMFSLLVFVFCFVVAFTGLYWKKTLVGEEPSFFYKKLTNIPKNCLAHLLRICVLFTALRRSQIPNMYTWTMLELEQLR